MTIPQKTIHNAITGEIIIRDYNADELAQLEKDKAETQAQAAKKAAKKAAKEAARKAVLAKLGISAEEAAALLG
jgi:hypothetical protein